MMADTTVMSNIAGLHRYPTEEDFRISLAIYNDLTKSDDLTMHDLQSHINELGAIIIRHGHEKVLGTHLIHSHTKLSSDTIMLGHPLSDRDGLWYKETPLAEVDPQRVTGHIFKLTSQGWVAYDYVQGVARDLTAVSANFILEMTEYIGTRNLHDVLGLQLLQGTEDAVEIDCGNGGTVMLPASQAKTGGHFRTYGWTYGRVDGGFIPLAKEHHEETVTKKHKVFVPAGVDMRETDIKNVLREHGVID